jgi:hypothetical protein
MSMLSVYTDSDALGEGLLVWQARNPASGGVQRRQGQMPWEQLASALTRAMQGQHIRAEQHLDAAAAKPLNAFRQRGMLALRGVQVRQDDNRQLHADRLAQEPEDERVRDPGRPLN